MGGTGGASLSSASPPPETDAESSTETTWTGIDASGFDVEQGRVQWAQTFTELIRQYGVDYQAAVRIAREARSVFDVRDMKANDPYRVYVNPWLQEAQYLVYEASPREHVVLDVQNPSQSRVARRDAQRRWKRIEARVDGSLYEALTDQGGHPVLALRLSEVFAWQIDFFRLRRGDSLQILYERRFVDGEPIMPGDILAARIVHRGEEYLGFRFEDGGQAEYYDEDGQSLRRELLKAPLRYTRISSGYSESRRHPILGDRRPHRAIDYAAPRGTPVRAVGSGAVQVARYKGPNGNYVKIRHNSTYTSGYLHLSSFADGIHPGARVQQGQVIGYVGSTGRSTGPHLDYRLWRGGHPVNPLAIDLPPSHPVLPHRLSAYRQHVQALRRHLDPPPVLATRSAEKPPWLMPLS